MARFHLRFRDFKVETLQETDKLFSKKPWREENAGQREQDAQEWADALCHIYNVPKVKVVIGEVDRLTRRRGPVVTSSFDPLAGNSDDEVDEDVPADDDDTDLREELRIPKWSLLLLFKAFREHMLQNGYQDVNTHHEDDVHGWACSLFYKVRPTMFRARVREGRIGRVSADDLLATETLRRREEEERQVTEQRVRQEMAQTQNAEFEDIEEDDTPADTIESHTERLEEEQGFLEIHSRNADCNVSEMTTRPLRRYATGVGLEGAWELSKKEILLVLAAREDLAQTAQAALAAPRSAHTGAVV